MILQNYAIVSLRQNHMADYISKTAMWHEGMLIEQNKIL